MNIRKLLKQKKVKLLIIVLIGLLTFTGFSGLTYIKLRSASYTPVSVDTTNLQKISLDELKQYDGSDSDKPIYIGLNGYVYDVTPGRSFYETGGTYHYLAGKDSSAELNLIGGDIIIKKYKVIGVLI